VIVEGAADMALGVEGVLASTVGRTGKAFAVAARVTAGIAIPVHTIVGG